MQRLMLVAATLALLLAAWAAGSQTPPLTATRIAGDLYLITGEGGNVALYTAPDGAVLVDDMFYRNHDDILGQVRKLTDRPLRYVINTHQHDDHAGGNARILPLAEVIAHDNVYANLTDLKRPYYEDRPGTPIGLPRVTFSDRLSVHLGGRDVTAYYFGRGHTSGDAVIHFPAAKAIHTGDLFLTYASRGLPIYVDAVQGGSLLEWQRTLDRALQLDFDIVIPGHGPVATRADLVRFAAAVGAFRDRLQTLVRQGTAKAELLRILESDYGWRSTGCPPPPQMTAGCLQYQQIDALIDELR